MFFTLRSTYFEQFCTNKVPTIGKNWIDTTLWFNFFEGLIGDYWQTWIRPGGKATDIPKRLLNPEAYMKKWSYLKERKKTVICTNLKWNKWVRTSYVCDECGVALSMGQCWEKYHTKKEI